MSANEYADKCVEEILLSMTVSAISHEIEKEAVLMHSARKHGHAVQECLSSARTVQGGK